MQKPGAKLDEALITGSRLTGGSSTPEHFEKCFYIILHQRLLNSFITNILARRVLLICFLSHHHLICLLHFIEILLHQTSKKRLNNILNTVTSFCQKNTNLLTCYAEIMICEFVVVFPYRRRNFSELCFVIFDYRWCSCNFI